MTPTVEQVLALPIEDGTLRGYLIELLATLWTQGSDFSAKRPLGDTDWQWLVYAALVKAGYVQGEFDADGYLMDADTAAADVLIEGGYRLTRQAGGRIIRGLTAGQGTPGQGRYGLPRCRHHEQTTQAVRSLSIHRAGLTDDTP